MSSIKPQPLGVVMADALRREIVDGRLRGGQELRQEELAERFGTSRIPVREAMQALERDGLIVVHPNRRSVVAQFDNPEIQDHYRVRALIEGEATFACADVRAEVAGLADIQSTLEAMSAETDSSAYEHLNHQFHSWIWRHSGSPWLERLAQSLWQGISPYTPSLVPGQPLRALTEHRNIVDAIELGSSAEAQEAMRAHILRSCDSLLEYRRTQIRLGSAPSGGDA